MIRVIKVGVLFAAMLTLVSGAAAQTGRHDRTLRVCAAANNLPYSNKARQGYENKLAAIIARGLGRQVSYTWSWGRDDFLEHTLFAGKCDVVMGVPPGMPKLITTRPYFESTYVFVYRQDRKLSLSSMSDPRLHRLRVGVHLIGDNDTPPAAALTAQGIVDNVKGFVIDPASANADPSARAIKAVERGDVDVAAVWGPVGGYYAKRSAVPLAVVPITDTRKFAPLLFRYQIAIGVRPSDSALRRELDRAIAAHAPEVRNLLDQYDIPVVQQDGG